MDIKEAVNLLHQSIDYEMKKEKIINDCNCCCTEPFIALLVNQILKGLSSGDEELCYNISTYFEHLEEDGAKYLKENYKMVYDIDHAGKCNIYYFTNDLSFKTTKEVEDYLKSQK